MSGRQSILLRTDLEAPVLELQAEGDVVGLLNSLAVRQSDNDRFRLWEVAGTSHADARMLGEMADLIDCGVPVNNGPMHLLAKAALRSLDNWVRTGQAPPKGPPFEVTEGALPEIQRDGDGIALGGIRTPPVDVPVDVLSGVPGPNTDVICLLLGSTTPLSEARLAELYPSSDVYEQKYATDADRVIQAGFVLENDRDALMAYAQPSRIAVHIQE